MACFVLILLFVQDERRYDRHHQHAGIVALPLMEFTKLVLLAFVIAVPVAYLAMDRWLSGFAYHVDISWWIFPVAGLTSLAIALLTISYQSIRAATADPVKALRIE